MHVGGFRHNVELSLLRKLMGNPYHDDGELKPMIEDRKESNQARWRHYKGRHDFPPSSKRPPFASCTRHTRSRRLAMLLSMNSFSKPILHATATPSTPSDKGSCDDRCHRNLFFNATDWPFVDSYPQSTHKPSTNSIHKFKSVCFTICLDLWMATCAS